MMKTKQKVGMIELKWSILILCYFVIKDNNEDEPSTNRPRSSSKVPKQPPPTFYKDKYRHLLGSDSGKDAAKATKSNSAYGYGKYTGNVLTALFEYSVTNLRRNWDNWSIFILYKLIRELKTESDWKPFLSRVMAWLVQFNATRIWFFWWFRVALLNEWFGSLRTFSPH